MVTVEKAVIARLKKQGHTFEILVDCDKALDYKTGKPTTPDTFTAAADIFKDVKKGEKASEHLLQQTFNTTDPYTIAGIIVKHGEVQLTQEHRNKIREEKKKRIITIIHRNAIDSKTGLPHPPQRIERAMEEAKVHIDDNKTAEEQLDHVLKQIRAIIPIKFETRHIAVKIPPTYAGLGLTTLKKYTLLKDEWQNDGSLIAIVEIPAGITDEFYDHMNKVTHGEVETKIIQTT